MNIIRRHNLDISILCQDSLQRVSDIGVLSHGTVCQLRPSRPIGQLKTFILLKKLEVSIRENNCRTAEVVVVVVVCKLCLQYEEYYQFYLLGYQWQLILVHSIRC